MAEYKMTDSIKVQEKDIEVKDLTLEDLYELYEQQKLISLVKIINGDLKLFLEKEE